jgi:hypothetical protein
LCYTTVITLPHDLGRRVAAIALMAYGAGPWNLIEAAIQSNPSPGGIAVNSSM